MRRRATGTHNGDRQRKKEFNELRFVFFSFYFFFIVVDELLLRLRLTFSLLLKRNYKKKQTYQLNYVSYRADVYTYYLVFYGLLERLYLYTESFKWILNEWGKFIYLILLKVENYARLGV